MSFVRRENPREIRNRAEKQRRDKLNHSISELASMVPPVMASNKKIDKTGVLRLTAHYLRAFQYEKQRRGKLNHSISELGSMVPPVMASNKKIDKTGVLRLTAHYLRAFQYVFGNSLGQRGDDFSPETAQLLLSMLGGFLLTTTYRGLVVVVSQNVERYLGHTELELLGQNIFNYVHPDDHGTLKKNLMPTSPLITSNGELLLPENPDGNKNLNAALSCDKRRFQIRFKKHTQRSEPTTYVRCFVEGTLRLSDRACRVNSRACQVVRRARARTENPCNSGNDVVFIGLVRPDVDTFVSERRLETYRMEYRTRHSVDGEILECDQRIAMVAGYMRHEVNGVNAMNFIHKNDVRWVIFNLRAMYEELRVDGESCYRLRTKSGQFIYMRTRGLLDVDEKTRAVRSFVCTNTMVDEEEGKHFITLMKKRCFNLINSHRNSKPAIEELKEVEEILQASESESVADETLPVQDLERVILYLVTNLPSPPPPSQSHSNTPVGEASPAQPLAIIPPEKERIVSAIEKIYSLVKAAGRRQRSSRDAKKTNITLQTDETPPLPSPIRSQVRASPDQNNLLHLRSRWRLEEFSFTTFTGQMENPGQQSVFPSLQEMSSLTPIVTAYVPPPSSSTAAPGFGGPTEEQILQFLNTGNINLIQGFGLETMPPQSNQISRKRGQSNEQPNVNKKKSNGIPQAVTNEEDLFPEIDLSTLDVDVQNLEDLDPSSLWDFKKSPQ
ncbi:PAS domain-containing protein [Phthorimaea operculella]|nr:PAS domain-containing protein [Phthorimaea operculella]